MIQLTVFQLLAMSFLSFLLGVILSFIVLGMAYIERSLLKITAVLKNRGYNIVFIENFLKEYLGTKPMKRKDKL